MLIALAELRTETGSTERGFARRRLHLSSEASVADAAYRVLIHDLSENGMMIETIASFETGDEFEVELPGAGPVAAQVVWSEGYRYGCEFTNPVGKAVVSASMLLSPFERAPANDRQAEAFTYPLEAEGLDYVPTVANRAAMAGLVSLLVGVAGFMGVLAVAPFSIH